MRGRKDRASQPLLRPASRKGRQYDKQYGHLCSVVLNTPSPLPLCYNPYPTPRNGCDAPANSSSCNLPSSTGAGTVRGHQPPMQELERLGGSWPCCHQMRGIREWKARKGDDGGREGRRGGRPGKGGGQGESDAEEEGRSGSVALTCCHLSQRIKVCQEKKGHHHRESRAFLSVRRIYFRCDGLSKTCLLEYAARLLPFLADMSRPTGAPLSRYHRAK